MSLPQVKNRIKVNKRDIGRWVTVKWDDVGRVDCLLVDINSYGTGKVFEPYEGLKNISMDQIIEKRDYINAS